MANTGLDVFDHTLQNTNKLLSEIERELGWENRRNQSYLALRTVLHALRDRLPIDEAVNFSAQLTVLEKGIFFDGWDSDIVPVKMNREEFVNYVAARFPFEVDGGVINLIKIVLSKVFESIDPAEGSKIIANLPNDIREIFC